ncbi:MAG: SAM-dependent methyltransferase, partial [Gaiellales bacterium]
GTAAALVAGVARHVAPAGRLVSGFGLGRSYSLPELDRHAADNGLVLEDRFATWDRQPWCDGGDYAVSVHRRQR